MTSHEPDDDASQRPRRTTVGPPVDPFAQQGRHAAAEEASEPAAEEGADLRYRPVEEWDADPEAEGGSGYRAKHDWSKDSYDRRAHVAEVHPPAPPHPAQDYLDWYRKEQDREAFPKPEPGVIGKYPYDWPLPTQPPDTVRAFSSLFPKPRHRRSDWPVLTFVLSVAAAVMVGCCLAGFALFTTWNPFTP